MAGTQQCDGLSRRRALCVFVAFLALPVVADSNPQNDPTTLRNRGYELAYNLDHDQAMAVLRRALALAPDDPANHRALAAVTWLQILFRHGAITVDHYLGGVARSDVKVKPPPPELARQFRQHADRALAISEQRLRRAPDDARAY